MQILVTLRLMHGLVELLDYLDDQYHIVLSCVHAPWTWGGFYVFCVLFRLPNVGQGYNDITLSVIVILCASLGRTYKILPPVSLWFRSLDGFPTAERMLPIAGSGQAICAALAVHAHNP